MTTHRFQYIPPVLYHRINRRNGRQVALGATTTCHNKLRNSFVSDHNKLSLSIQSFAVETIISISIKAKQNCPSFQAIFRPENHQLNSCDRSVFTYLRVRQVSI